MTDVGPPLGPPPQPRRDVFAERSRPRNRRAITTSVALIVIAAVCISFLVGGVNWSGDSKKEVVVAKKGVQTTSTTRSSTTTSTTSTTVTTSTTTTTTIAPVTTTTIPPEPTPTTRPRRVTPRPTTPRTTTPTTKPVGATVSTSNEPVFCTLTIRLSTGPQKQHTLDGLIQKKEGAEYDFTSTIGGYAVDVHTVVVKFGDEMVCSSILSNLRHA